jgi:hypothetical protein
LLGIYCKNRTIERDWQLAIFSNYPSAELEVYTEAGKIDIVYNNYCIELKIASGWKAAVGQAICYSACTGLKPAIVLIGEKRDVYHRIASKFCKVLWVPTELQPYLRVLDNLI